MAKDNHRGADDLDHGGGESSHAADEPTAVWDIEALRKAGLSEVIDAPETPVTGPATPAMGMEVERPSIIVEQDPPAPTAVPPAARQLARKRAGADVGWVGLITIAAMLGAIAYGLIRLLR